MQQGQRPKVFGDGGQTRDFCYIDNVIEANLKALHAPAAPGHVYNVACGERVSLLDVVAAINLGLGTDLQPEFLPPRDRQVGRGHLQGRQRLRDGAVHRRPQVPKQLLLLWPVQHGGGLCQNTADLLEHRLCGQDLHPRSPGQALGAMGAAGSVEKLYR